MTSNDVARRIEFRGKDSLRRQSSAWRFFARAVLIWRRLAELTCCGIGLNGMIQRELTIKINLSVLLKLLALVLLAAWGWMLLLAVLG